MTTLAELVLGVGFILIIIFVLDGVADAMMTPPWGTKTISAELRQ